MKRVWAATAVLAVMSAVLDIALSPYAHGEFWWHNVPAFDFVFGFVGCGAIVIFSKWIGHKFLMKDEDYYESDR